MEGALVRQEFFNSNGALRKVLVYASLEGDRIIKEDIRIPDNVGGVGPATVSKKKSEPVDQRYSYRLKYIYDGHGNRIEELRYGNDGLLQSRRVSVYDDKESKIELRFYSPDGKLFARRVRVNDDRGNVTEETLSWTKTPITEKLAYKYDYDPQGNWIKQTMMRWVTSNGKSFFKPTTVFYRTISYF